MLLSRVVYCEIFHNHSLRINSSEQSLRYDLIEYFHYPNDFAHNFWCQRHRFRLSNGKLFVIWMPLGLLNEQ